MEKVGFFANPGEFNYGNGDDNPLMATSSSLLNLNWEAVQSSTERTANFESAISSLVSSPTSSSNPSLPSHSVVIRELIGRLGSICNNNSNHNSPPNSQYRSTSTSCYTTPLHSPPNLSFQLGAHHHQPPVVMPPFAADPGFAERAAKFSCFGAVRNPEPGNLSRVSSSQSLKAMNDGAPFQLMQQQLLLQLQDGNQGGVQLENMETMRRSMMIKSGDAPEEPSVSGNVNVRKRKSPAASSSSKGISRGKDGAPDNPPHKAAAEDKPGSKKSKSGGEPDKDAAKTPKAEQALDNGTDTNTDSAAADNKDKDEKDSNAKPPEHPKQDYIHVRARRGQATDSHSLAERVRREKISERMKFLQDLVPGCNKVTGKAIMLDEIINYVQSLQRQVEFLSMKLATVNPRSDISVDSLLPKDMHQPRGPMLPPHSSYPLEATSIGIFSYANQPQEQVPPLQSLMSNGLETQLDPSICRSLSMHLSSLDGLTDATASQLGAFWEDDDLQSVVQMGFGQNQEPIFSSQNFPEPPPTSHMKIEL